jgi:hypothetical protein
MHHDEFRTSGYSRYRLIHCSKSRSRRVVNLLACLLLIVGCLMAGCTAMGPIADNAETLRTELRSGEAIKPGDKVRVVTRDGLSRLLIVTAIDQNTLKGRPEGVKMQGAVITLPIDDIVFMEGKKVSAGKTAAYTMGGTVGTVLALGITLIIAFAMTW